jgi:hypothetical protein
MATPTLATRYTVKLFASTTATRPLVTSRTQTVYVTTGGSDTGSGLCQPIGQQVCHLTFKVFSVVPGSALRVEMSKRFYPYFGVTLGQNGETIQRPQWLYLDAADPSIAPARQVAANEYERTVTFSFDVGKHSAWRDDWVVCVQDTLSKDGLGLPGHHGCGASKVRPTVTYLG